MNTPTPLDPTSSGNTIATVRTDLPEPTKTVGQTIETLAGKADDAIAKIGPSLEATADQAAVKFNRGMEAVRDRVEIVKDKRDELAELVTAYTREKPIQALLIAAAVGASLMVLLGIARSDD